MGRSLLLRNPMCAPSAPPVTRIRRCTGREARAERFLSRLLPTPTFDILPLPSLPLLAISWFLDYGLEM